MKLLVLLLLSPAIIAQGQRKGKNPNDEPFMPIFPVYPYNPKLMKRGTERNTIGQPNPELYAPKPSARDSYTTSYNDNYQWNSYHPNYNSSPKSPSYNSFPPFYSPNPYVFPASPDYNAYRPYTNPYTINPYSLHPYLSNSYPNYYYQPPYVYPNYYTNPAYGIPEFSGPTKPEYPGPAETTSKDDEKNSEGQKARLAVTNVAQKLNEKQSVQDSAANSVSSNSKDLVPSSNSYRTSSPYNQLGQWTDTNLRNLPIPLPRTMYRVVSVAGQPVPPDYPLPATYAKLQQLEQAVSQTLAKILGQNSGQEAADVSHPLYETNNNVLANQNALGRIPHGQFYSSPPAGIAKTGLMYVASRNPPESVNDDQYSNVKEHSQSPRIQDSVNQVLQNPASLTKTTARYQDLQYLQKPMSHVIVPEESTDETYVPSAKTNKGQSTDYKVYESESSQANQNYYSDQNNYALGQAQSYPSQNLGSAQTPRANSYHYRNYHPAQSSQQLQQQYKTSLDDVNFGAKQNGKG